MFQAVVRPEEWKQPLLPPESVSPQRTWNTIGRPVKQPVRRRQFHTIVIKMDKDSIFKDPSLESEFDQNGYIRVPFLNEQEILRLASKYQELHPNDIRPHTIPSYASGY